MKVPLRVQLTFIALGYAAVLALGASFYLQRYLLELRDPAAVVASSGMFAFAEEVAAIFLIVLFLVPTFFLLRVMRNYEPIYAAYSRVLLGISVTAPICFGMLTLELPALQNFSFLRLFRSPFVLVLMGMSRIFARFQPAKRFVSYALLIEGVTFVAVVVVFAASIWVR